MSLPPKVLHTLLVLVENSGRVVEKDELMKALWPDTFVEEGNLTQNISTLRKVLGESPGEHVYIETVPKQGYRFVGAATGGAGTPEVRRYTGLMLAGLLAAVLLIAGGLGWRLTQRTGVARSLNVTPVTSYPGLELHPAFAPDGNHLAFVWDGERQDNLDIYVKIVGSDRSLRLTFDEARDFRPAWSPDGRWIAFLRRMAGGYAAILTVPATGGSERRVAIVYPGFFGDYDRAPLLEWTPDGKWLLTADRMSLEEASSLFLISVETGQKRRLTAPPPVFIGDLAAAISADGRMLAFSRSRSGTVGQFCTVEMAGSLTPAEEPSCFAISEGRLANFGSLRWIRDRREVIFSPLFRGSGRASLWTMPLPGRNGGIGEPQRFPVPSDHAQYPAISRDGRRLVYSDFLMDVDIWRLDLPHADPANPGAASAPVRLITSTKFDWVGQYSPDGKKIVFISSRSGHPAIWVAHHDGSNAAQLTTFEAPLIGSPRWSPDGQHILFDSTLEGDFEVYRINADGGGLRRLTYGARNALPSWSRDGRWIYFTSTRSGVHQVWKMPAGGGDPAQVTTHGGDGANFESFDGKFLYYAKGDDRATTLWRVPVNGGNEVQVLDSLFSLHFTVAASGVYFIGPTDYGRSIRFLSFQTGKVATVAEIDQAVGTGLSVSPDGRFLLYSQYQLAGSDLMLVENFR
jgi:Tol biopolymer transport system component